MTPSCVCLVAKRDLTCTEISPHLRPESPSLCHHAPLHSWPPCILLQRTAPRIPTYSRVPPLGPYTVSLPRVPLHCCATHVASASLALYFANCRDDAPPTHQNETKRGYTAESLLMKPNEYSKWLLKKISSFLQGFFKHRWQD